MAALNDDLEDIKGSLVEIRKLLLRVVALLEQSPCPRCDGTGQLSCETGNDYPIRCRTCQGSGKVPP